MIERIKQELYEQGEDLNDFNVTITKNGYSITPKWFYETKQIAKKEDKSINEDVNVVAETTVITMDDINTTAETVALLIKEIKILKTELEVIKNG